MSEAFTADAFGPNGIDDRTESAGVMNAAQEAAATAWGRGVPVMPGQLIEPIYVAFLKGSER